MSTSLAKADRMDARQHEALPFDCTHDCDPLELAKRTILHEPECWRDLMEELTNDVELRPALIEAVEPIGELSDARALVLFGDIQDALIRTLIAMGNAELETL